MTVVGAFASAGSAAYARVIVNDAAKMNSIAVDAVISPTSAEQISGILHSHNGPICIGGGRYSQGGQIATEHCLFLDMRHMNRILSLDGKRRTITIEAGATWRQIQEAIDPHQLSLKIMQSYSNFTVGGSLSVNAHGRYVGEGPIVSSVLSLVVVTAGGKVVHASRSENRDIFDGVIGGYGGLGVIVQATLQLVPNTLVERSVRSMSVRDYPAFFLKQVLPRHDAVFHSATLYPPSFTSVDVVTWSTTQKQPNISERLAPLGTPSRTQQFLINWLTDGPFGKQIREFIYDPLYYARPAIAWRNFEASDDVASLNAGPHAGFAYALQEYFVPTARFSDFVPKMARIFSRANANVLNVSIRYSKADKETLLSWAPADMFAFVIYYQQETSPAELATSDRWTEQLIDCALSEGGTYYMPYRIVASRAQFLRAYRRAPEFFALKSRLDPQDKFRNRLWDAYYRPSASATSRPSTQVSATSQRATNTSK